MNAETKKPVLKEASVFLCGKRSIRIAAYGYYWCFRIGLKIRSSKIGILNFEQKEELQHYSTI